MPPNLQDHLPAMLRLAIDAWPALAVADIDGWLWRSSGGGSKRANSVATLAYNGTDVASAIATVGRRYRERGQLVRFQVEEIGVPTGLAEHLIARGYVLEETTVNMAKSIASQELALADKGDGCSHTRSPTLDWLAVYLSAITPDRRVINEQIVHSVPKPRAYFLCRHEGQPISSGLCVASGDVAIVECMATAPERPPLWRRAAHPRGHRELGPPTRSANALPTGCRDQCAGCCLVRTDRFQACRRYALFLQGLTKAAIRQAAAWHPDVHAPARRRCETSRASAGQCSCCSASNDSYRTARGLVGSRGARRA